MDNKDLPRCDRCNECYRDWSKKYKDSMTEYCKLLNRDVGQSHFGHNSPRICPLRKKESE